MNKKSIVLTIATLLPFSGVTSAEYVIQFSNSQSKGMIPEASVQTSYSSCKDLLDNGQSTGDGVYTITVNSKDVDVYCDMSTDGGGWTVIQRRLNGSVDFYRNWADYKAGFGNVSGEYWLGNDNIHNLTKGGKELMLIMEDAGNEIFARYNSTFEVGNEATEYYMTLDSGSYTGNAGNDFGSNRNHPFTTLDRDNDDSTINCAVDRSSGWWHYNCNRINLNGLYNVDAKNGIVVPSYSGFDNSMDKAKMMIR